MAPVAKSRRRDDDSSASAGGRSKWSPAAVAGAFFLFIFGFLPLANWLPDGHAFAEYSAGVEEWFSGSAIVIGAGLVLAISSRRLPGLWRDGFTASLVSAATARPWRSALLVACAALAVYAAVAQFVFDTHPLLIDEIIQHFQAQTFADGMLWRPAPANPEFFASMHLVETDARIYGQFPAGGPAMLLPGILAGAPWLVGPVFGAVCVVAFHAFVRVAEPRPSVVIGSTVLFAAAPFVVFMAGSQMNHLTTLAWLLIAVAALARVVSSPRPQPALGLLVGFAFGMAATIRPLDAIAFALPAGLWLLSRALRDRSRWLEAAPAAIGIVLPVLALMWVNAQLTGHPLRFGYIELWGRSHELGFHESPWGPAHTPARGLELVNLNFLRLQTYLFETPLPSLLPVAMALALAPRLGAFDRYLLASGGLLIAGYFAYWHDGFYLGPRFMYPLAPLLALWTARLPALIRERFGSGLAYRTVVYGGVVALLLAMAWGGPLRVRQYANMMYTMRWDADGQAEEAGVRNALVLVRESWGSETMARLWERGVPRTEAERFYRTIDTCMLHETLDGLERTSVRGAGAVAAIAPLQADSSRLFQSRISPDVTERVLPGARYTPRCNQRIREDSLGFTLFPPLMLARGGGNVYARDMHARDSLLLKEFPGRPIYLLKPQSPALGEPPRFYAVDRDSLKRAWAEELSGQE